MKEGRMTRLMSIMFFAMIYLTGLGIANAADPSSPSLDEPQDRECEKSTDTDCVTKHIQHQINLCTIKAKTGDRDNSCISEGVKICRRVSTPMRRPGVCSVMAAKLWGAEMQIGLAALNSTVEKLDKKERENPGFNGKSYERVGHLKKAQISWEAYREKQSEYMIAYSGLGSIHRSTVPAFRMKITAERALQLYSENYWANN